MLLFLAVDKGSEFLVDRYGDDGADHSFDEGKGHVEEEQAVPESFDMRL